MCASLKGGTAAGGVVTKEGESSKAVDHVIVRIQCVKVETFVFSFTFFCFRSITVGSGLEPD